MGVCKLLTKKFDLSAVQLHQTYFILVSVSITFFVAQRSNFRSYATSKTEENKTPSKEEDVIKDDTDEAIM